MIDKCMQGLASAVSSFWMSTNPDGSFTDTYWDRLTPPSVLYTIKVQRLNSWCNSASVHITHLMPAVLCVCLCTHSFLILLTFLVRPSPKPHGIWQLFLMFWSNCWFLWSFLLFISRVSCNPGCLEFSSSCLHLQGACTIGLNANIVIPLKNYFSNKEIICITSCQASTVSTINLHAQET